MAVIHMLMCLLNLYEYAKKNLGPLRSTVGTVECALIVIVGPVCQKFKGVPDDFLAFLDTKVNNKSLLKMKRKNTKCLDSEVLEFIRLKLLILLG